MQEWKKILDSVQIDNNFSKCDILEQIKENLNKKHPEIYQEWERNSFDINHLFNITYGYNIELNLMTYKTSLLYSAFSDIEKHQDLIEALLNKGATLNGKDIDGRTLLHLAVIERNVWKIKDLIEKGADVSVQDNDGNTPLHLAARGGYESIVNLLLDKGADVNKKTYNGYTSLHWAVEKDHKDVVKHLIEKGADVNVQDNDGRTPLHLAAIYSHRLTGICSHKKVVTILSEKGANVDEKEANGWTPLHLAVDNKNGDEAKLLIAHEAKLKGSNAQKPEYLKNHGDNYLKKEMSECWNKCLKEIEKMEEEKIDGSITFYNTLTSKNDKPAFHVRRISKALNKGNYRSKFPIYANEIDSQYKKLTERLNSLDEGSNNLRQVFPIDGKESSSVLPNEICEKIVEYLDNIEIENLNKAVRELKRYSIF